MKTIDYLDAVKAELGLASDYALAKRLNLTRAAVSKLRTGRLAMSNRTAAQVAFLLGRPVQLVIADMEIERGQRQGRPLARAAR